MATKSRAQLQSVESAPHEAPAPASTRSSQPDAPRDLSYLQRKAGNRAVQRLLQRNAAGVSSANLLKGSGPGRPLPEGVRQKMESYFATDFSDVRVHLGDEAPSIGAAAFAMGSEIHFAPEHYNPDTFHGQGIIGHELTHVMQQREGRVRNPSGSGVAVVQDQGMEAEAESLGRAAAAHSPAIERGGPAPTGRIRNMQGSLGIGSRPAPVCQSLELLGVEISIMGASASWIAKYLQASWRPIKQFFRDPISSRDAQTLLLHRHDVQELVSADVWLALEGLAGPYYSSPPLNPGIVRDSRVPYRPIRSPDANTPASAPGRPLFRARGPELKREPGSPAHPTPKSAASSSSGHRLGPPTSSSHATSSRDLFGTGQVGAGGSGVFGNESPVHQYSDQRGQWRFFYHRHTIEFSERGYHIKVVGPAQDHFADYGINVTPEGRLEKTPEAIRRGIVERFGVEEADAARIFLQIHPLVQRMSAIIGQIKSIR